jgi:hypothetical protein
MVWGLGKRYYSPDSSQSLSGGWQVPTLKELAWGENAAAVIKMI